jgi:transposase
MLRVQLTPDERTELIRLEKQIPFKGVAIRIRIILALDLGYSIKEVSEILLLDEDTITKWKQKYLQSKYLSDWLGTEYLGYQGRLTTDQETKVEEYVSLKVVTDSSEILTYIKDTFGIKYTIDGVTKLLHRLDFVYKQTVVVPANVDPVKQAQFIKDYTLLKEQLRSDELILFLDGVHPTHNTQKTRCWIKRGINKEVKTNTGRDRLNIQGALDVANLDLTSGIFKALNAQTTIQFFDQIQTKYHNLTSIFCIVDNARYYKNKDVTSYLNQPGCRIKLTFLPPYSPNLNFIERLWKYLHQKIIGTKFRQKFKQFQEDILYFLTHIQEYQSDLKPFIGTKFRLLTT